MDFLRGMGDFIYLSVDKTMPGDAGFDEMICMKEEILKSLICLSYREDICFSI